ncbi:MAG: hypothetical protein Q9209_007316 [Squamulea sp. 1 TL-2023]
MPCIDRVVPIFHKDQDAQELRWQERLGTTKCQMFGNADVTNNNSIVPSHPDDLRLYRELYIRKPNSMQIWIAVGGYDFSDADSPTHQTWRLMTSSADRRAAFIKSVSIFMDRYGFQGVDLDWLYPFADNLGGSVNDATNFVALVREMRRAWGTKYGISATLPPEVTHLDAYDAKGMEPYVDFFGYLSYDLRASAGPDGIAQPHTDIRDIEKSTAALWAKHLDPKKLNLGLSNYGRGYTLVDRTCHRSGCKVVGPSKPGLCTNTAGLLFNIEIIDRIQQHNLRVEEVPNTMSKQTFWDDQWVGFDDGETMAQKTSWAADNCFGGTMIWSLDMNSGQGSGSIPDDPGRSTPDGSLPVAPDFSTFDSRVSPPKTSPQTIDRSSTSARSLIQSGHSTLPVPPIPFAPGKSMAVTSIATPQRSAGTTSMSGLWSTQAGQSTKPLVTPPVVPGKPSADGSTSARSSRAISNVHSGQQTLTAIPGSTARSQSSSHASTSSHRTTAFSSSPSGQTSSIQIGQQTAAFKPITTSSSEISSHATTSRLSPNSVAQQTMTAVLPIPLTPGKSMTDPKKSNQPPGSTQSRQSGQSITSSSTSRSSHRSGPSIQSSGTISPGQASAAALLVPGIATIPSPTITPGSMVTEGAVSITALIPLALAVQLDFLDAREDLTWYNESPASKRDDMERRQVDTPGPNEIKSTIETLASAYASLGLLEKEVAMLSLDSLPGDVRKIVDNMKKGLPGLDTGTKAGISNLANAIKDSKNVNMEDIKKANSLLGAEGSVTRQIDPILKPLTNWVAPKGSNDIILPGIMTLPTPSLGDGWKGTVIPGILTVPSPTLHWHKDILSGTGARSSHGGGTGDAGGGGGGILAGLLGLAKQAESAVQNAGNTLAKLSGQSGISTGEMSKAVSLVTSATEDVGGLGAALDSTLQDAIELDERFGPAALNRVVNAKNKNKALFVDLSRVLNDLSRFINKPPQALLAVKRHSPKWFVGGSIALLLAGSDSPTISAWPAPIPVIVPSNSTNTTNERIVADYFIVTVPNTTVKAFQDFIKTLPDKGVGTQRHYEWPRQYQTYLGRMTRQDAEVVNKDRIVAVIGPNKLDKIRWGPHKDAHGKDKMLSRSDRGSNRTKLVARRPAWQEFQRPDYSFSIRMPYAFCDDDPKQGYERGDQAAALAIGKNNGVANKAALIGIKSVDDEGRIDMDAEYESWRWIVQDVQQKRLLNPEEKAVVSYSEAWDYQDALLDNRHVDYSLWGLNRPFKSDFFLPLLVDCWAAEIVTVFAAGDDTEPDRDPRKRRPLGELSPQRHANALNPIIVAGSVDRYGRPSPFNRVVRYRLPRPTSPRDRLLRGEFTAYALAENADVIDPDSASGYLRLIAGTTTLAAPQIAGLAAYYMTLPGTHFAEEATAQDTKDWIIRNRRSRGISPDGFNITYNGIHEILQYCIPGTLDIPPPSPPAPPHRRVLGLRSAWKAVIKIFKRQQLNKETAIFENGHLTDPKDSGAVSAA